MLLAGTVIWLGIALATLARASSVREWRLAKWSSPHARVLWIAAAVAGAATPLIVTTLASVSVVAVLIGAALVYACLRIRVPGLSGRWGLAVDAAVVILLALLVPDLVVIRPEDPGISPADRNLASIMQFHHDFLVGPANQVMGGDVLLRDTASQYGVGSIYLLAGWFELMTISYGSFALLDGILTAALLAVAYAVLRIAGCSRVVAGSALAVGVVALVYNRAYPVGLIPQEGPFRFGLPMGVILCAVVAARWPRWERAARYAAPTRGGRQRDLGDRGLRCHDGGVPGAGGRGRVPAPERHPHAEAHAEPARGGLRSGGRAHPVRPHCLGGDGSLP